MILRKAQPKRLGGFVLTGPVLAGLTEAYVAAINDGAVPTIATAWQVRRGGAGVLSTQMARSATSSNNNVAVGWVKGLHANPDTQPHQCAARLPHRALQSRSAGGRRTRPRRREWMAAPIACAWVHCDMFCRRLHACKQRVIGLNIVHGDPILKCTVFLQRLHA